jgi:hypothetical protein
MEQFSHAVNTPFGYTLLGEELGHLGDTQMAEDILDGTLENEALRDEEIQEIVKQLRQHPAIQQIIKPIITVEDFKSTFKCVPEKTASSYATDWQTHKQGYMPLSCISHYSQDTALKYGNTS